MSKVPAPLDRQEANSLEKHVDRIINAVNGPSYTVQEVYKALDNQMAEEDWRVACKALILVHLLMRHAPTDAVYSGLLGYQEMFDVAGFQDTSGDPLASAHVINMARYAKYLKERVATYRMLQNDVTRNRESQELAIAQFRSMETDTLLLDDIMQLQKQLDALLDCKYSFVDNPILIQSIRLLAMDLKLLFHVLNEAVIPLLERFFEMKKKDSQRALEIYQLFVRQTERTVDFFNVAKKLRDLNMEIPTLKPPPASLAATLENYIKDPNFERNRQGHIAKRKAKQSQSVAKSQPAAVSPRQPSPKRRQEPAWATEWETDMYNDVNVMKTEVARQTPQHIDFFGSLDEEFASFQPAQPVYSQPTYSQPTISQPVYSKPSQSQQFHQQQQSYQQQQSLSYAQASGRHGSSQPTFQQPKQRASLAKPGQIQPFAQTFHANAADDDDWAQFDKAFPTPAVGLGIDSVAKSPFQQQTQYQQQMQSQQDNNPFASGTSSFGTSTNPFASTVWTNPFGSDQRASLDIFDPLK